ncbi:M42 family metallopeptidase [Enterococcus columbae]|uniref:M42 glutamyl aminopeptidase n=1 Tax=Enterococcus columbae DSM 7374 = ATCC 51263 TaxID=1121865 RepID=S0KAI0_9ENTE|nr:M42 family metallopeptidase [Enterococcus columbae]EOT41849.1 M42 glutamyl aminopeptidase [Enterococcus columbae DSM 7374 = ATCC 51263]EOW80644.1 M42 glutamyl aminopeptidase [Enterococcus columbae DSM 7374 = ATCC 51263]OJG26273.1 M42 glutamyl aminopeptidase [Enterococcus columbae DSM 7374 = ATCC 51263]
MLEQKDEQLLIDLTSARGVPGNEEEVREIFKAYAKPFADEIMFDGIGSVIAKHGQDEQAPKIFISGHMDEVGFMVTKITEKGFIEFQTLGGWWSQVMLAQQVEIKTSEGKLIHGVIGCKPPHVLSPEARKQPYDIKDMFIDVGATSEEEVKAWGVRPGDMITPYIEYKRLNDTKFLLAKAWDNRVGTAVALRVLENLATEGHNNQLYAGSDVMEEVGLRGARTSTYLVNPDIALALDTGTAGDTPGMTPKEADSVLGKGPQILIFDASMIPHKKLLNFVVKVAEELEIPFQYAVIAGGGTDAGQMHLTRKGVPSLAITVPVRYLHSHTSVIHEDDYLNTVKLVTEVVRRLDRQTVDELLSY